MPSRRAQLVRTSIAAALGLSVALGTPVAATASPVPPDGPTAVATPRADLGAQLLPGQTLRPGDRLSAPGGRWSLVMSTGGALLLQDAPNRLNPSPSSQTLRAGPAGSRLALQTDGNLVLYGPDDSVQVDFGTAGSAAQRLVVQDDGNLVLYRADGSVVLELGFTSRRSLSPGQVLLPGDALRLIDTDTVLVMQGDGNLVLYAGGRAVFSTGTYAHPGAAAILQTDGNLVVYSDSSPVRALFSTATVNVDAAQTDLALFPGEFKVLGPAGSLYGSAWTSPTVAAGQVLFPGDRRTSPQGVCTLALQTDGNLVDYCAGEPVFSLGVLGSTQALMNLNGNFAVLQVLGPENVRQVFSTGTTGYPGSRLVVQDDRNLVVYTPQDRPVFSLR